MVFETNELFDDNPFWPIKRNLNNNQFIFMHMLDRLESEMANTEINKVSKNFINDKHKEHELITEINSTDNPVKTRAMGAGRKAPPKKLFNINQKYRSKFL